MKYKYKIAVTFKDEDGNEHETMVKYKNTITEVGERVKTVFYDDRHNLVSSIYVRPVKD